MKTKLQNSATWIWYPGDYEIWLGNKVNSRRTERGMFVPPFWKMDSHYILVEFSKQFHLANKEQIEIYAEGQCSIKLDGVRMPYSKALSVNAGRHSLNIKVYNQASVPAIFVRSKTLISDNTWRVTFEDRTWIDQSGHPASASAGVKYVPAGSWNFYAPNVLPSTFSLDTSPLLPQKTENRENGILYDFGRETFGYIVFNNLKGKGNLNIYYGESPEEAMDTENCELYDCHFVGNRKYPITFTGYARAFRYAYVEPDKTVEYSFAIMLSEFLDEEYRGNFRCSDKTLNAIFEVAAYTLHLTAREFFIDGIKRDHWIWSGDACQSYLMNYYLFFDTDTVKRTIFALRGKDPVTSHINTILDYTFYWFISIYDYYRYSGDRDFIALIYPRMKTQMDYCLNRRNTDGMMEGLPGDWVFIDWADFPMDKNGEISFEQLLFCQSLKAMAACAATLELCEDECFYSKEANILQEKIFDKFWDNDRNAFAHKNVNGKPGKQITPFVNIFAVLFDFVDAAKRKMIKQNVLLNPDALKITTPYMRFYELEALCILGEYRHVINEIRNYWGGMLSLGATAFWEKYNPEQNGTEHLEMYGRPYGKSLCHSWGASPLYLFGKYLLGIKPEKPGYKEFSIRPKLGDLKWIDGTVPVPGGEISIFADHQTIKVLASKGEGYLYFQSLYTPVSEFGIIEKIGLDYYRIWIESKTKYEIKYGYMETHNPEFVYW